MKLSFRWYGEDDKVTLENIRQIPGMQSIVTAVYDVPVGEVWSRESIARLKKQVEDAGLGFDVIESIPVHEDIKLGKDTRDQYIANYCENIRRVAEAVKIPVSVKLPMRLTNVLAVADSLLARGARGVVMFNRFFEPDIDVERMTFVNGDPFSEPAELRNVLRSVALCTTAVPQLDVSVSTGVHDGEAAVKALLCGANAVQICSAIHEKGYGVIVDINRFIDLWAERHGFGSLAEFRGKMNYGNAESDVYQRVQYMKYFPHDAE